MKVLILSESEFKQEYKNQDTKESLCSVFQIIYPNAVFE